MGILYAIHRIIRLNKMKIPIQLNYPVRIAMNINYTYQFSFLKIRINAYSQTPLWNKH